jgi:type II secretory pathway component PulM
VLSREMGRNMQISTQSVVLTPNNSIYKEYSCEEKKKEAAGSYAVVAKKKTVTPKKAVSTKVVIPKNEYLHGFISRSKKILSMKKIFIALVLIFGITIAAQNNTTGQEKTYTQKEVDLMMQMQEQKISEMQKSVEKEIGMQDKYVESINSRFGFWLGLFGGVMTFLSIGSGFLVYYLNKRTTESEQKLEKLEKDVKDELKEIRKIKEEASKDKDDISEKKKQAKEELTDIKRIKEEIQNNKNPNEQSPELQKEIKTHVEKTGKTKPIAEYTADDWFLLGYNAQIKEKYEDACFY